MINNLQVKLQSKGKYLLFYLIVLNKVIITAKSAFQLWVGMPIFN